MQRQKGKEPLRDSVMRLDERLGHQLEEVWRLAEEGIHDAQRSNDGHQQGTPHCRAVEENLGALISDEWKGEQFSATELFVLSAAAALHDIGKAGEEIDDHGYISMRELRSRAKTFGLDDGQAEAVGWVVQSHDDGNLDVLPVEPYPIGVVEVRLRLLAALFKLADMLHTDYRRVSRQVAEFGGKRPEDNPKTLFRMRVRGWRFNAHDKVELYAVPKDWIDVSVINIGFEMTRRELEPVIPTLRDAGLPWGLDLHVDDTDLEHKVKLEIEAKQLVERAFVGMDYFTEADAGRFKGRDGIAEELQRQVMAYPLTLLVGDSGVGKTSVVHAGLFPLLRQARWYIAYLRPFDDPDRFVIRDLWRELPDLLAGEPPTDIAIVDGIARASKALGDKKLLIVLDQFEDVIRAPLPKMLDGLQRALVAIQAGRFRNLRLLVSYRSDAEGALGPIFQDVAGSARGLPRTYLQPLSVIEARAALEAGFDEAQVGVSDELLDNVTSELERQSTISGVYPPYLQIVGEILCQAAREKNEGILTEDLYNAEGRCEEIISRYLLQRLGEFGEQEKKAWQVVIALVRSTGVKEQRSLKELVTETGLQAEELTGILAGLVDRRIVRHLGVTQYEIVHDLLAQKVLEETEEEQIRIKEATEAFELAVRAWQRDQVVASPQRLDLFYKYRDSLKIGEDELMFLLVSESQGSPLTFGILRRPSREKRLRWIDLVSPTVCIGVLDRLLERLASGDEAESTQIGDLTTALFALFDGKSLEGQYTELIIDLCQASSMEVQKRLVAKLIEIDKEPERTLYYQAYAVSPISTQPLLTYLQEVVVCSELEPYTRHAPGYRILEYYRTKFPVWFGRTGTSDKEKIKKWVEQFPLVLLDDEAFRTVAFNYLRQLKHPGYSGNMEREKDRHYRIEMFKLLCARDPDSSVKTMWDIVNDSFYIGQTETDLLKILLVYDRQPVIDKVVDSVDRSNLGISYHVELLEAMAAPEADALLISDLEHYVKRFKQGSKYWTNWKYRSSRQQEVIQAIGRRQLKKAKPLLTQVALRYETQGVKLDCIQALVSIGGEGLVDVLVKLLDDHFQEVRNQASKYLCEMNKKKKVIASKIVKSIAEQKEHRQGWQAKRSAAMERKINTLWRLRTTDPRVLRVLEQVAQDDDDESIRQKAAKVAKRLKNL